MVTIRKTTVFQGKRPLVCYGQRPVRAGAITPRQTVAALLAVVWLVVVPGSGAQDAQSILDGLERAERSAALELYAAESALAAATADADRLEARTAALAAREARVRRATGLVRASLALTQRRVERTLRALYVEGDRGDPIAIFLGADSLDAVLEGLDGLERAAATNRRLAQRLARHQRDLTRSAAEAARLRAASATAQAQAEVAAGGLERAVSARAATLRQIRARGAQERQRIEQAQAQARAAVQAAARLEADNAPTTAETPANATGDAGTASTPITGQPVPPSGGRTLVVDAVAYHLPGRTASGLPVGVGVIAVDPSVIPLGTRLFVPGYGPAVAADVGSAIKGNIIDLWMPSTAQALAWGRRTVTITIYG
ncbi:MAG: 3D domain-containing protein [Gaiella sp.]